MTVYGKRWRVVESVGEGGQAHTYLVEDRRSGSAEWVLKRLKNHKRLGRFQREVTALQNLSSDYIPSIEDYSFTEPSYVVVPRLGADLTKHEGLHRLGVDQLLDLFLQTALALHDAHRVGVVHRDIKPNNIVLSSDNSRIHVIDFGICQYTDRELTVLTVDEPLGNPAFAAPECFLGRDDEPTSACDVYSLGKVLYWMTSNGRFIHREQLSDDVLKQISTDSDIKRFHIARLVRLCVQEEPTKRPSAVELIEYVQNTQKIFERINASEAQGLPILVDRFGPANEFNRSSSRSATSAPRGNPPGKSDLAVSFTTGGDTDVSLASLVLALSSRSDPDSSLRVSLLSGADAEPDETCVLEEFVTSVSPQPQLIELSSRINPQLKPGKRYWVKIAVSEPNSEVAWWSAPLEFIPCSETLAERQEHGSWRVGTASWGPGHALRVIGQLAPRR